MKLPDRPALFVYKCPLCRSWHLTKQIQFIASRTGWLSSCNISPDSANAEPRHEAFTAADQNPSHLTKPAAHTVQELS